MDQDPHGRKAVSEFLFGVSLYGAAEQIWRKWTEGDQATTYEHGVQDALLHLPAEMRPCVSY